MLPHLFPGKQIDENYLSFYRLLFSDSVHKNIIVITNDFKPSVLDIEAMLEFVSAGNNIFISSFGISGAFADTLGFSSEYYFLDTTILKHERTRFHFSEKFIDKDSGFIFTRNLPGYYFNVADSKHISILGTENKNLPNFIDVSFGKGKFFLHCQPVVFTNYHLLHSNHEYACKALSYLPVENTLWDQYYKPIKYTNLSPVKYILSQTPLKMGYYLIMIAIALYLIIGGRRKQRPVPVVLSPRNESLFFINTIGRLYYNKQNHSDLAKKIVTYLKDFIRRRYRVQIDEEDQNTIQLLSAKSLIPGEDLVKLFDEAKVILGTDQVSRESLLQFYKLTEDFYNCCL